MAYVGNIPADKYSSLTQQTFSSPTGTSFVLSTSVSNSIDIALFIDNVRQDPTSYTAVGTALTTSTISSPSTMYCLFIGKTVETVSPSAGSVDSSHLVAGSVDDSHISGLAASKLTGALPAISGASLTNLPDEITKSSSDPTVSTNPSGGVGTVYLNTTSGEMFSLTDATAGANIWTNIGEGVGNLPSYLSATGGVITTDGSYKAHTFTSSGIFTPTVGSVASGSIVEYLVIAGGGGSGPAQGGGGGGGGAGGYRTATSFTVSDTGLTVTVGAGGAGGSTGSNSSDGANGSNSVFSTVTSAGGGGGAAGGLSGTQTGLAGGSGGGGGHYDSAGGAGNTPSTSPSQGNNGGANVLSQDGGAGGGGAGAVGGNTSGFSGGVGGVGVSSSITGSAIFRSGGGGGASSSVAGAVGGNGGGGAGGNYASTTSAVAGTVNTGGGAGAAYGVSGVATAGGSGVVIIRYQFQA